ncbi:hypothetical protein EC973_004465 [Apophysomyces ossiformis]|uniref:Protein kinase domain-containing protein n=1 Tax=Apophysomyces ossiformis TaxID=679940 RepID=A0A8H7BIA4_9FUNG|nr:hypothetical protein EC973_004465 [Apophysomyces ossiformis]
MSCTTTILANDLVEKMYAVADPSPEKVPRKRTLGPYELLDTLGVGEFGKVKLGMHMETGQQVAVKLIKKINVETDFKMDKVQREIAILHKLKHPYIVKLLHVIETEHYIGMILEYASGGELFDYILARRTLDELDARRFFAQVISSVQYMHYQGVVHRDLKLENLLLDANNNVIVTDFGFANQFSLATDLMATSCGSPCYAAPELVIHPGHYLGPGVDIWSCGVILYAMLCGYLPFDDDPNNPNSDDIQLLYKYILSSKLQFPAHVSLEAQDLITQMLVPDPQHRASLATVMSHPWLAEYADLFEKSPEMVEAEASDIIQQLIPADAFTATLVPSSSCSSASSSTDPTCCTDDGNHLKPVPEEEEGAELLSHHHHYHPTPHQPADVSPTLRPRPGLRTLSTNRTVLTDDHVFPIPQPTVMPEDASEEEEGKEKHKDEDENQQQEKDAKDECNRQEDNDDTENLQQNNEEEEQEEQQKETASLEQQRRPSASPLPEKRSLLIDLSARSTSLQQQQQQQSPLSQTSEQQQERQKLPPNGLATTTPRSRSFRHKLAVGVSSMCMPRFNRPKVDERSRKASEYSSAASTTSSRRSVRSAIRQSFSLSRKSTAEKFSSGEQSPSSPSSGPKRKFSWSKMKQNTQEASAMTTKTIGQQDENAFSSAARTTKTTTTTTRDSHGSARSAEDLLRQVRHTLTILGIDMDDRHDHVLLAEEQEKPSSYQEQQQQQQAACYQIICTRPRSHAHENAESSNNDSSSCSSSSQSTGSSCCCPTTPTTTTLPCSTNNHHKNNTLHPSVSIKKTIAPIFADPVTDPGEEVRFLVEIRHHSPGTCSVDVQPLSGSPLVYNFLSQKLLDLLNDQSQFIFSH